MKLLITGGTRFVSRFAASYFVRKGHQVFVLNRNTRPQEDGVQLICADRSDLGSVLKPYHFDAVIDVCGYNAADIRHLADALFRTDDYIFISSSAVYPEANPQPFRENQPIGKNTIWGAYGSNKVAAEQYLQTRFPDAYILRPPYLYGPMQNLYREPFVFDCAEQSRTFYIPKDGAMPLQFFHVEDLCRVIERILETHPARRIWNVGNADAVDINTFVQLCYQTVGAKLEKVYVKNHDNQRDYFCFHDYAYTLDVTNLQELLPQTVPLETGLRESYTWYQKHRNEVQKRPYLEFIDRNWKNTERETT